MRKSFSLLFKLKCAYSDNNSNIVYWNLFLFHYFRMSLGNVLKSHQCRGHFVKSYLSKTLEVSDIKCTKVIKVQVKVKYTYIYMCVLVVDRLSNRIFSILPIIIISVCRDAR